MYLSSLVSWPRRPHERHLPATTLPPEASSPNIPPDHPVPTTRSPSDAHDTHESNRFSVELSGPSLTESAQHAMEVMDRAQVDSLLNSYAQKMGTGKYRAAVHTATTLVEHLKAAFPENKTAIYGARLGLAEAKYLSKDAAGALSTLKRIDPRELPNDASRAHYRALRSQVEGQLQFIAAQAARKAQAELDAQACDQLHGTAKDAVEYLDALKADKTPQSLASTLNPLTAVKLISGHYDNIQQVHQAQLDDLNHWAHGAKMAAVVMRKHDMPLEWMKAIDVQDLAVLAGGLPNAMAIKEALKKLDGFTIDTSHLTTEIDVISTWSGGQVRQAHHDSPESALILDTVAEANRAAKQAIAVAGEYYAHPARAENYVARTGAALTWGGDMLASVVTVPATVVDPKISDQERAGAVQGTMLMLATMGALKNAKPLLAEARGILGRTAMAKTVHKAVGELLEHRSLAELQKLSHRQLADDIYRKIYNPSGTPKPATISQEAYAARIKEYPQSISDGYWHRRFGEAGNVEGEAIQRFYFNVRPDHAPELAEVLTKELNAAGIKFQYKMPEKLSKFDRSDAAVLYVEKGQAEAVQKIITQHAKANRAHFAEGSPAFTEVVEKGIARADEPLQLRQPPGELQHSFGTSRSSIIAEAVKKAPPNATPAEVQALVRQNFQKYGIDPDKPWLNPVE